MDPAFTELCHCIQEKCRRDGWYGGTLDLRHAKPGHPQRHGFAYPPASEEQLYATETALGFLLPPVLRYDVLFADGHSKNLTRSQLDQIWAAPL